MDEDLGAAAHVVVARLEKDSDGTWWYVHVPMEVRQAFAAYQRRGIVPVTATIGATSWDGSLLPWADGSAQLSVNKRIRKAEGLDLGDELVVTLRVRH
jgi:hypothetical protein